MAFKHCVVLDSEGVWSLQLGLYLLLENCWRWLVCLSSLCVFTLLTPTEYAVLDRKGVRALKSSARLVAVAVHVLHNLVRQLSEHLMVTLVMMMVVLAMMVI